MESKQSITGTARMSKLKKLFQKETFKSIGYVGIGKAGSALLGLATIALSARGLGVESFGILALFLSIIELVNLIALPGFNLILQKSLHNKNYNFYKEAYKYSFLSSITLGFLTFFLVKLSNNYFNFISTQVQELVNLAIVFVIFRSLDKSEAIFPALKEFKLLAIFSFLSSVIRFIGLGLTAFFTQDLEKTINTYILFQVFFSLISLRFSIKAIKKFSSLIIDNNFKQESIQMSLVAFLNTGIGQLDRILLYNLSAPILGLYQAGISYPEKLREVGKTFIMTISNTWLSFGDVEFRQRTKKNSTLLILILLLGAISMFFAPRFYIPLLLGSGFEKAIPIAEIMGVIVFIKSVNFFFQSRDIVFESIKRHQAKVITYRLSYILLLLPLIKQYDIRGVLLAIFISEIIYFLMLFYDYKRKKDSAL